jgi:hypothetical protein
MERIPAGVAPHTDVPVQLQGEMPQETGPREPGRLSGEDVLERLRKALAEIDDERLAILDRHHEMVAKSQKMTMEYIRKKLAEKRIFDAEQLDDALLEKAIVERINSRNRLEEDALKRNLKDG